ncbi:hypothetical protein HDU67_006582 [Dinochytrium kinnereticum]|nr:hypothetical protein HDU67_006582 [Dinochytrium kinnereticum]
MQPSTLVLFAVAAILPTAVLSQDEAPSEQLFSLAQTLPQCSATCLPAFPNPEAASTFCDGLINTQSVIADCLTSSCSEDVEEGGRALEIGGQLVAGCAEVVRVEDGSSTTEAGLPDEVATTTEAPSEAEEVPTETDAAAPTESQESSTSLAVLTSARSTARTTTTSRALTTSAVKATTTSSTAPTTSSGAGMMRKTVCLAFVFGVPLFFAMLA